MTNHVMLERFRGVTICVTFVTLVSRIMHLVQMRVQFGFALECLGTVGTLERIGINSVYTVCAN